MTELSLFHFLRPGWLWLLPLAIAIPWMWRWLRRPSGDWARVCDPHLLRWLSVGSASAKKRNSGVVIAGLGLLISILALAGPSWVKLPDASFTARDARVIALDLSNSMLAGDLKPDRLTQARYRLADLLGGTTEGQVGMVAFAGDAFVVSPLTNDMNTIANLLPALRPDIIPVEGSRADRALELAATLIKRAGTSVGEVLLVTDSGNDRTAAVARKLRDEGIFVSVLAVGTPEGAPIPKGGGFLADNSGNVVIARVDTETLRTIATAGGGSINTLNAVGNSQDPWADRDSSAFERREEALEERWQDAGPWLVLLLIPILLAGFRRGLLFTFAVGLVPVLTPSPVQAGWWDDLWQRRDQQAWHALEQQQPALAAALAQDPGIAGEGAYRAGDYEGAARSWAGLDSADDYYNRGNALALQGDFDNAIAAYENALQLEPDMHDAIYNKNVIEKLKQEQQQQQQQQGEGEQDESQDQESQPSDQTEGEQQEGEQQEGEQESESEQQEGEREAERQQREIQEAWSEEDAQAMEQWLRRIPDDPGGLLRRKFRNEYLRRGEQESEEQTW
jgi:Ca-activated chloride channel family protein